MEKVDITIQFEVGRLKALDFFLFDKQNTALKTELEKYAEELYEKHVPEDTRRFVESQMKPMPAPKPRTKRIPKTVAATTDAVTAKDSEEDTDEQS